MGAGSLSELNSGAGEGLDPTEMPGERSVDPQACLLLCIVLELVCKVHEDAIIQTRIVSNQNKSPMNFLNLEHGCSNSSLSQKSSNS